MKSLLIYTTTILNIALVALLLPFTALSQVEGSGNVIKQDRPLPEFNRIEVGSAFTVILTQGEPSSVIVETDDNLKDEIHTLVNKGTLQINSGSIKNPTSLKAYVTAPNIREIELSGAARLVSKGVLELPLLRLVATGASRANIEINTQELSTVASGASRITLKGSASTHNSEVSGASSVNAMMLRTITTNTSTSGASKISVFAKNKISADVTGAGVLTYFDNPDIKKLRQTGKIEIALDNPDDAVPPQPSDEFTGGDIEIRVMEDGDSTFVKLGDMDFSVFDGYDSTFVKLGNIDVRVNEMDDKTSIGVGRHNLEIDDEGNVQLKSDRKEKYDGHWGGFDIGINGLLNEDYKIETPQDYEFLDQKMEKSINIGLNIYEQNFNLIGENFGLTTGLGLEWNNYRFKNNAVISNLDTLAGYLDVIDDPRFVKSKLVTTYLTLPIMFELQSNSYSKVNSFHLGVGVLSGLRIGTHTKLVDENDKKDKDHGSTAMSPFKLELMARAGWGKLNIFAKYSLTQLFKENRGPEVYPFAIGITLVNW
jgi:hypothetical protein